MQNESNDRGSHRPEDSGGAQRQSDSAASRPARPVRATIRSRGPGDRTDGITKLEGTVTFTRDGIVGINLKVDGGSTANTSTFKATGAQGNSIGEHPTERNATLETQQQQGQTVHVVVASDLPAASESKNYTVQVSYALSGTTGRKKLQGTVPKAKVSFGGSANDISLT